MTTPTAIRRECQMLGGIIIVLGRFTAWRRRTLCCLFGHRELRLTWQGRIARPEYEDERARGLLTLMQSGWHCCARCGALSPTTLTAKATP